MFEWVLLFGARNIAKKILFGQINQDLPNFPEKNEKGFFFFSLFLLTVSYCYADFYQVERIWWFEEWLLVSFKNALLFHLFGISDKRKILLFSTFSLYLLLGVYIFTHTSLSACFSLLSLSFSYTHTYIYIYIYISNKEQYIK